MWSSLVRHMLASDIIDCYFIERPDAVENEYRKHLNIPLNRIIKQKHLPLMLDRYMPVRLKGDVPYIFHSSYYRHTRDPLARQVVTLHDFIYELTKVHSLPARWAHGWQKKGALKRADAIACISKTTQRVFHTLFPSLHGKVTEVIYNAIPYEAVAVKAKRGDRILFVGGRIGYKNFELAIRIADRLHRELVIVGNQLTQSEEGLISRLAPNLKYECFGIADSETLQQLYADSYCLLYPSSMEGFGIPIIEAQMAGCPVVISSAPACVETGGTGVLVSPQEDVESFCHEIDKLSNDSIVKDLVSRGYANAQRFDFRKTALEYMQLYSRVLDLT